MSQYEQNAMMALEQLKKDGAEKATAVCGVALKEELNFQGGELSLLRSTTDHSLSLSAIRESRRAALNLNQFHRDAILSASGELRALCEAGAPDPAHDIAPAQPAKDFRHGEEGPDLPRMKERLGEFLETVKRRHPSIILEEGYLSFTRSDSTYLNSNGVKWNAASGYYTFFTVFTAKEGTKMSSFNYVTCDLARLDTPLVEECGLNELLRESAGQLEARSVPGKFQGEVLLTPHVLRDLLDAYLGYLSDAPLISGTSVFKGKLGSEVASPLLTLRADPLAPEHVRPEFYDGDGFESRASNILDKGVLRSYLLSLYGANKTGLPRALSSGSRLSLDAGTASRATLLGSMKKGIVLTRFSGGRPAANGDFSGVAKNSYYVEGGEIRHALAETMVSGNLLDLFRNVTMISRERLSSGVKTYPWLLSSGVTVSGK